MFFWLMYNSLQSIIFFLLDDLFNNITQHTNECLFLYFFKEIKRKKRWKIVPKNQMLLKMRAYLFRLEAKSIIKCKAQNQRFRRKFNKCRRGIKATKKFHYFRYVFLMLALVYSRLMPLKRINIFMVSKRLLKRKKKRKKRATDASVIDFPRFRLVIFFLPNKTVPCFVLLEPTKSINHYPFWFRKLFCFFFFYSTKKKQFLQYIKGTKIQLLNIFQIRNDSESNWKRIAEVKLPRILQITWEYESQRKLHIQNPCGQLWLRIHFSKKTTSWQLILQKKSELKLKLSENIMKIPFKYQNTETMDSKRV